MSNLHFKKYFRKNVDFLLKEKEGQSDYDFIKDFNTFMYSQTLHHHRKHFCHYFLQSFSIEKTLERYINDWFEINGKQMK